MPELPEVETVRRQLAVKLAAARFVAVVRAEPAMLLDCTLKELKQALPGKQLRSITRIGKFLVVRLETGDGPANTRDQAGDEPGTFAAADMQEVYLTLHLGMTGQLLVFPREEGAPGAESKTEVVYPHTRFAFDLRGPDGAELRLEFRDTRKFGRLHLTVGAPPERLARLGPDAWEGEWDVAYLQKRMQGRRIPLKSFLLDQRNLAGIGNIYADESLWWARLSPLRPAGSLAEEEVGRLAIELRRRLDEGIRLLGCSISDFVDTQGNKGRFQEWLRVYGKQRQPCLRCGVMLERVVINGRGTTYCPGCQT